MNSVNFEKWICNKVVPNLPTNLVDIMNNAVGKKINHSPSQYILKSDIIKLAPEA